MEPNNQIIFALRSEVSTPLVVSEALARRVGIGNVMIKDETRRPLGNFKMLGGLQAGLKALARSANVSVDELLMAERRDLPPLVCASDGNHGLAVAVAAQIAGARAIIFLHEGVDRARARRIKAAGAEIVTVEGTYDDAVDQAVELAASGQGLLVPDTSDQLDHPAVADVMAGYGRLNREIAAQLQEIESAAPTHLFVQAGVGGLAAVMADGLARLMRPPAQIVVIEPESAACVSHALRTGRVERIPGKLETSAEMLSCGVASAIAVDILLKHEVATLVVSENELKSAVPVLRESSGISSTPSGAAGLAGLLKAGADPQLRSRLKLEPSSSVLVVITEGELQDEG